MSKDDTYRNEHEDPKTDQPTRIGHKQLDSGKYVRISTRSGEMIDPE